MKSQIFYIDQNNHTFKSSLQVRLKSCAGLFTDAVMKAFTLPGSFPARGLGTMTGKSLSAKTGALVKPLREKSYLVIVMKPIVEFSKGAYRRG